MSYKNSRRKRFGNWLAGSKFSWIRKLSDVFYTSEELTELKTSAKIMVDNMIRDDREFQAVLDEHPEITPLLCQTDAEGLAKYDFFTKKAVLVFRDLVGIEKCAPFLSEFGKTEESYELVTFFIARMPYWLREKGYLDKDGGWTKGVDDAALEAASQMLNKELAGRICKTVPGSWDYDQVVQRLQVLL